MAHTREHLLASLRPPTPPAVPGAGAPLPRRLAAGWRWLRWRSRQVPGLSLALDGLQGWWQAQPWHTTGQLLATRAQGWLAPAARRHPWVLLATAAAAGGAVAWWRPWRWAPLAPHLRALPGPLSRWAMAVVGQLPVHLIVAQWLGSLPAAPPATPMPAHDRPNPEPPSNASPHPRRKTP